MRHIFFSLIFLFFTHEFMAQPGPRPEPGMSLSLELQIGGRILSEVDLKKVMGWAGRPENKIFPQVKDGLLHIGIGNRARIGDVAGDAESLPRVLHLKFGDMETEVNFEKGAAESLTYAVDLERKQQDLDLVKFKHTYRFSKIDNRWIHDTTGVDFSVFMKNKEGKLTSVKKHWTTFKHPDRADSFGMQFWVEGYVRTKRSQTYDGFDGPVLDFLLTEKYARRHMELAQVWGRTAGPRAMHESLNFESWRFTIVPTQSDLLREVTPPFSFHDVSRADLGLPKLKVHLCPKYSIAEGDTVEITLYEFFMPCENAELKGFWKITEEGDKKYLDLMLDNECDRKKMVGPNEMVTIPYTFQLTLPKGVYELRYRNAELPKVYPDFMKLMTNSLYAVRLEVY